MVTGRLRTLLVKLHWYVALWFGLLFVMAGLSGTVIAWREELDAALNPDLLVASQPAPGAAQAMPQAVIAMLEATPGFGRPRMVMPPLEPHAVYVAWCTLPKRADGMPASRQVMVDPTTLAIKGERVYGAIGLSRPLLMNTLFLLHRYVLLGDLGRTVMATTGVLLLITLLTGLALWWPKHKRKAVAHAFKVSYGGSWPRLHYSLHRAVGFYVAPVLVVTAFSGIYLSRAEWIKPVVGSVAAIAPEKKPQSAVPPGKPERASVEAVMASVRAQYPNSPISRVSLPAKPDDVFELRVAQPGEPQTGGATRVWVDAYSAQVLGARDPLRSAAGDTMLAWMFPLHTGEAFGLAGRIVISLLGLMPLLFAVTGLLIWNKRRKGHKHAQAHAKARAAHTATASARQA